MNAVHIALLNLSAQAVHSWHIINTLIGLNYLLTECTNSFLPHIASNNMRE